MGGALGLDVFEGRFPLSTAAAFRFPAMNSADIVIYLVQQRRDSLSRHKSGRKLYSDEYELSTILRYKCNLKIIFQFAHNKKSCL